MSESSSVAAPSAKRPLEDPSSPSGPTEQPDAKRPALDKMKSGGESRTRSGSQSSSADANGAGDKKQHPAGGGANGDRSRGNGDGKQQQQQQAGDRDAAQKEQMVDDGGVAPHDSTTFETQPIQSTTSESHNEKAAALSPGQSTQDESRWIHIRAVISSAEAATCIGKGGENVSQIRRMSGAKCTVSEYQRGAVERILTVSGQQDAVAKAFGLIIRTLNSEPLESPSTAESKQYSLHLLIPHILIGSIIGKAGVRIREIQEASGARLNASDSCLPLSTERSLVILGVADAVHIATYYVAVTLVEQLTERFGGPAASAYATRNGGPAGIVPGGMQVVPYVPQIAGGQYGAPDSFLRHHPQRAATAGVTTAAIAAANPYGMPYPMPTVGQPSMAQAPVQFPGPGPGPRPYVGAAGAQASPYGAAPMAAEPQAHPANAAAAAAAAGQPAPMGGAGGGGMIPGQATTQQIFIPNDMVGAIIGKRGAKINEIRHLSGSGIKINDQHDNSNERLVTITGTPECNRMALYMLFSRLESEKHRM